jgi:hypothetical protein
MVPMPTEPETIIPFDGEVTVEYKPIETPPLTLNAEPGSCSFMPILGFPVVPYIQSGVKAVWMLVNLILSDPIVMSHGL